VADRTCSETFHYAATDGAATVQQGHMLGEPVLNTRVPCLCGRSTVAVDLEPAAGPHLRPIDMSEGTVVGIDLARNLPMPPPRRRFDHETGERSWQAFLAITIAAGRGARRRARRRAEAEGFEVAVVSKRGREVYRHVPTWRALCGSAGWLGTGALP